jgi:uracil-DNA glycosylase
MSATLWDSIPVTWQECLSDCRTVIDEIDEMISANEESDVAVVPRRDQIFASLAVAPSEVVAVIIGQDPYPTSGHANGLAFAVSPSTVSLPASLKNIFKEVAADTGTASNADSSLQLWVEQGVLLLNTSLTTQVNVRAAHASWPWDEIVTAILNQVVKINPKVAAVLWGNHAKQFSRLFDGNSVVTSAHPSPLSASRGFLGSKPFTRVNTILEANHKPVISW